MYIYTCENAHIRAYRKFLSLVVAASKKRVCFAGRMNVCFWQQWQAFIRSRGSPKATARTARGRTAHGLFMDCQHGLKPPRENSLSKNSPTVPEKDVV